MNCNVLENDEPLTSVEKENALFSFSTEVRKNNICLYKSSVRDTVFDECVDSHLGAICKSVIWKII